MRPCRIPAHFPGSEAGGPPGGDTGKVSMAKKGRTAVLKRQREVKKAERAALKREKRETRKESESEPDAVATAEDLEGYGFGPTDDEQGEDEETPPPERQPVPPFRPASCEDRAKWPTKSP